MTISSPLTAAAADASLTVASYNIHKGVGTDRRRDLSRTAAVIAEIGADVLALQEADTRFGTRTGLLNLDALRDEAGLTPVPLDQDGPAHGWHGNLLLLRDAEVHEVRRIDLPGFEPRGALMSDVTIRGHELRIVNAHFGLLPQSRTAQSQTLIDLLTRLEDRPTLLLGDLNEWRGKSRAFAVLARHFPRHTAVPSYPTRFPLLPLDRLMTCNRASLTEVRAHDTPLARRASDHLPVKARLSQAALPVPPHPAHA